MDDAGAVRVGSARDISRTMWTAISTGSSAEVDAARGRYELRERLALDELLDDEGLASVVVDGDRLRDRAMGRDRTISASRRKRFTRSGSSSVSGVRRLTTHAFSKPGAPGERR